jgi:tight adherence protein C
LSGVGGLLGGLGAHGSRAVFMSAVLAFGGWRWPELRDARRAETRRRQAREAIPDTLDLLAACVRSGSSVTRAFAIAAEREPGPLGDAMRDTVSALEHGVPKAEAYRILCRRADVAELRVVASSLQRVERLGIPLADTLDALATEMRERRRSLAEERARSAPVRMLFPVILCFLPAFVLLTIAPVLIVAVRGFRGT